MSRLTCAGAVDKKTGYSTQVLNPRQNRPVKKETIPSARCGGETKLIPTVSISLDSKIVQNHQNTTDPVVFLVSDS